MAEPATDVNTPVVPQDATPAEPSAAENNNAPEVTDGGLDDLWDESPSDKPEDQKPKDAEPKPEQQEPENPEEPKPEADQPTDQNPDENPNPDDAAAEDQSRGKKDANTRIRELNDQKNFYKANLEHAVQQGYQPLTAEELMQQGLSEEDARFKALESKVEVDNFNRQVTEFNVSIDNESRQVLTDFPIFDPDSDQYDPEFATEAAELYASVAGVQTDPKTGLYVGLNVRPYQFHKAIANAYQKGTSRGQTKGQVEGQQAAEQQLARVDVPPSAPKPASKKKDALDDLWDSDD